MDAVPGVLPERVVDDPDAVESDKANPVPLGADDGSGAVLDQASGGSKSWMPTAAFLEAEMPSTRLCRTSPKI